MEEEIDLRPYIEILLRRWYWIVGASTVVSLGVFLITSFISPTYKASALVIIINSNSIIQFDPRFRETSEEHPFRAFPSLAESDAVLQDVLAKLGEEKSVSITNLRSSLSAQSGNDISLLELTAVSQDPDEAAKLANLWADVFIDWVNRIYGDQGGEQVVFFEKQLGEATQELDLAEETLIQFQAVNRTQIISDTLAAHIQTQADYLEAHSQITLLIQETTYLRDQLAGQSETEFLTMADQVTAFSLQLKAYDIEQDVPVMLQMDKTTILTSENRSEQLAMLDTLLETLNMKLIDRENTLTDLEPKILMLQQELQEANTKYKRLLRDFQVAEETYTALARKVQEERITAADTSHGVRLASQASPPVNPVSPQRKLMTSVAFITSFIIAIFAILTHTVWQNPNNDSN